MYCESQYRITAPEGQMYCESQYRITARGADALGIAMQDHSHKGRCIVNRNAGSQPEGQMYCESQYRITAPEGQMYCGSQYRITARGATEGPM